MGLRRHAEEMLATDQMALVTNPRTGRSTAPSRRTGVQTQDTGRVADLSPALMEDLELETDDDVEVVYPWKGD